MGVSGQRHAPTAFPPGKRPGTHCIGGCVGPRVGVDGCGKSRPQPCFDPRTVQPVASCYTDTKYKTEYKARFFFVSAANLARNLEVSLSRSWRAGGHFE